MTKAARNALAWLHLTGRMPKYLRHHTWMAVYNCVDRVPFDVDTYVQNGQRDYAVKAEHVADLETHPMVVTVRAMLQDGWKIDPHQGRCKARSGVGLCKPGEHRVIETHVWPDGRQGLTIGS